MYRTEDDSTGVLEGQRYAALTLILIFFLVACQDVAVSPPATRAALAASPTGEVQATPAFTPTPLPSPTPVLRISTAEVPPATRLPASPTVSPPPVTVTPQLIIASPSPTATMPPPPFQTLTGADTGQISTLWSSPSGALWLFATDGLYRVAPEGVVQLSARPPFVALGEDGQGGTWILFDDGGILGALGPGGWTYYGPDQEWEAAPDARFGRGDQVVIDRQGGIWLALGREGLRRLDPETGMWTRLDATEVGFAAPPAEEAGPFSYDPRLAFTDVALDRYGNVWVAACAVRIAEGGPRQLLLGEGQGVRWFDGEQWAGPGESGARCVQDIEVDEDGNVWLAGRENLLWEGNAFVRYEPEPGQWVQVPVPETEAGFTENPRFASDFWFDGAGRVWMHVERRGGATFPPDAVYYREAGAWLPFLSLIPGRLVGNPDGILWLWLETSVGEQPAGLYRYGPRAFAAVPFPSDRVDPTTLAVDGEGRAWFVGRERNSLWYFDRDGFP